jgi:hypothetical protein
MRTMSQMIEDECPERDGMGMCHCKRVSHAPLAYKQEPCYPETTRGSLPKKKTISKKSSTRAKRN